MTAAHNAKPGKGKSRWITSAVLLCVVAASLWAAKKPKSFDPEIEQKRALHALDRLTFGPRPGDVQSVAAIGVDKWIEQQLHPEKIDDSAMQARLSGYRTLQMSSREMLLNFPPDPVIKAMQAGKLPMPQDPYRRAIYVAAIDRMQQRQEQKQNAPAANAGPAEPKNVPSPVSLQRQQDRHDAHGMIDDLILLPPDQRMQRILNLPVAQQRDLTQGLSLEKRQALFSGFSPEQRETVLALNNPQASSTTKCSRPSCCARFTAIANWRKCSPISGSTTSTCSSARALTIIWSPRMSAMSFVRTCWASSRTCWSRPHRVLRCCFTWTTGRVKGPIPMPPAACLIMPTQPQTARMNGPLGPRRWPGYPGPHPPQQQRPNPQNKQAKPSSGLNENYARELMELHTLGVNGGYTQQDVTQVARVFTGWTIDQPFQGGGFVFRPRLHEPGSKTVLGHTIKEGGEKEGMQVLEMLAHNPSTARFVSTELAQRFVSDNPPQSLIDAMSKTFLKTDGDLREVLRTMFRSPEFWAPEAYRARVKTPLEFVVSSLRATQVDIADPAGAPGNAEQNGHAAVRRAAADWLFHQGRRLGEFGCAARPHELRSGAFDQSLARRQFQSCATDESGRNLGC